MPLSRILHIATAQKRKKKEINVIKTAILITSLLFYIPHGSILFFSGFAVYFKSDSHHSQKQVGKIVYGSSKPWHRNGATTNYDVLWSRSTLHLYSLLIMQIDALVFPSLTHSGTNSLSHFLAYFLSPPANNSRSHSVTYSPVTQDLLRFYFLFSPWIVLVNWTS